MSQPYQGPNFGPNVQPNAQQQQQMGAHFAALQAQQVAQFQARQAGIPQNMNPALNAFRIGMNGPPLPVPQAQDDESDEDEEPFLAEDSTALSRINITIRSPIIITGNANLIACDAAATANAIALGVVQSLRQLSMGQHGIPMIDEQGRPRPLGVEVIAEMRVEGSQNVVGERAVLARMLDLKEKAAKRKMDALAAEALANGCILSKDPSHEHGVACIGSTTPRVQGDANAQANMRGGANGNSGEVRVKMEKRDREDSDEDADVKRSRRNF